MECAVCERKVYLLVWSFLNAEHLARSQQRTLISMSHR